ncbi:unnamed protein product, partial [Effrenium voratum]
RNVFLEIVQKLVAVALVSTVYSPDGLKLALGITLTTAAMVALVQPYLKPQANTLLTCCYLCLAVAAWAFDRRVAWLSRAALALPFLLTSLQSLTPDGADTRALRIWEDLEPQVQALQEGKVVEITAEPGLKSLGIHGFLKRIAGPETVGLPWVSRQIPTNRGPPFGGTLTLH